MTCIVSGIHGQIDPWTSTSQITHRSIVHILPSYRKFVRHREYDTNEECPKDASDVHEPPKPAISHIKRSRLEIDFGVVAIHASSIYQLLSSPSPKDRKVE